MSASGARALSPARLLARSRRAGARARRRSDAGVPLRGRGRGDDLDERAALDALERARPRAPLRLAGAAQGDAVRPDHADAVERARPRRPASRPRAETGDALHLSASRRPTARAEIAAGGTFWTAPAPSASATVRFAISGDADGARDPKTGKPAYNALPGLRPDGGGAEPLQHQPRRHDLLGQRGRRRPARTDDPGEVGEVQAEPRLRAPAQSPPRHRPLQPLGRPRVHQRLLAPEHAQADLPRPARSRSATTPPSPTRRRTGSIAPSAGASTSSSSSSTSARSARPRWARFATNDLAPTAPQAVRNAFAALVPRWRRPCRRRASTRSPIPRGRCSARASTPRSRRRSRPRRRPGR